MAVIVNGDGILTGISSLATALTDLNTGRGTVTGVATVGTLQLGTGVSMSSPRSQQAAIFTNNTEFFTVDDAGRVGVGTITPNSDAHPENEKKINVGFITARSIAGDIDANTMVVAGVSTFVGALNATSVVSSGAVSGTTGTFTGDVTVTGTTPSILLTDTDNNPDYLIKNGNGEFNIQDATASANRLSINSSGNVVVGSDLIIPDKIVHASDTNTAIRFPAADTITFETSGSERVRVDSSGNFGIGTDNPAYTLDVVGDGGGSFAASTNSTNGVLSIVGKNSSGSVSAISRIKSYPDGSSNQSHMAFETRNSSNTMVERMRINSSGKANIGGDYTQTTRQLGVVSDAEQVASFEYNGADADGSEVRFYHNSSSPADDDTLAYLQFSGKNSADEVTMYSAITAKSIDVTNGTEDGNIIFSTRAAGTFAERVHIKSGGNVDILDGNLIIGTSGHGIDFSATNTPGGATSELLDDYEEGTFSITWINLNVPGHATTNYATYTKVGRIVTIRVSVSVSGSVNDGSGIGFGLPYAPSSNERVVFPAISDRSGTYKSPFAFTNVNQNSNVYAKTLDGYSFQSYNTFSGNYIVITGCYESA